MTVALAYGLAVVTLLVALSLFRTRNVSCSQ
jgi:hypothetical protein